MFRALVATRRRLERAVPIAAPIALTISLAACASGGGGTSLAPQAITPPPPAPPPAVVSPFPGANPPTVFDGENAGLIADINYALLNGKLNVTGINQVTQSRLDTIDLGFTYLGPNTYSFDANGFGGPTFSPSAFEGVSGPFDIFKVPLSQGYADNLELATKDAGGVALTYLTFGDWTEVVPGGQPSGSSIGASIYFFTAGSRTPAAQMPRSGSAVFTGIADGLWVDGAVTRRLFGSVATLTVDFGAGQLTSTLDLVGHSDPFGNFEAGPTTPLGVFTGSGAIAAKSATFSGAYDAVAGYSGTYTGGFYGPSASEYGLAFSLTGGANQTVVGVAVGKH